MVECFNEKHFARGETLLTEGTRPSEIYVIISGEVKLMSKKNPYAIYKYSNKNKDYSEY